MFIKNDESFICDNCGLIVDKLKYTSRDHCNHCLYSKHVDIEPGDRKNTCKGLLRPINIITENSKTKICYSCIKCGKKNKNIVAEDDNKDKIIAIVKEYAKNGGI